MMICDNNYLKYMVAARSVRELKKSGNTLKNRLNESGKTVDINIQIRLESGKTELHKCLRF